MKRLALFIFFLVIGVGILLFHQGYANNTTAQGRIPADYEFSGINLKVTGAADVPAQDLAQLTKEDFGRFEELGCRFVTKDDGSVLWEFPMRESIIYQRQKGKILMMAATDTLGNALMPLPPSMDNLEIVLANGMGTELESFPIAELTPNAKGIISLNYYFPPEAMGGCHDKKEGQDSETSCCNGGNGCIDDNGPYAFWSCSNWQSGFFNSDCSYAWAYAGRCAYPNDSYCSRSGYGSNCSPLIGHNPCWHWWWQGSGW